MLEHMKQHVRNHLLNIRYQIEGIQSEDVTSPSKRAPERLHEMTID